MTKPMVPADLMPSAILCYTFHTLSSEAYRLIQRCREVQIDAQWRRMDRIALDVKRLRLTRVPRDEQAIVWVHLADTYWMANAYEPAQRYFEDAVTGFSLLSDPRHRHNEAAAVYGLGLVSHATGDLPEAQKYYGRSLDLLQRSKAYWASEGQHTRTYTCDKTSDLIRHLKDLCVDCPLPPEVGRRDPSASVPDEEAYPIILSAIPADGAQNVPVDASVVIVFSHPINRSSVDVEIVPNQRLGEPLYFNWYEQDTIVVVRPQNNSFDYDATYQVRVIGAQDRKGRLLKSGPVPRNWSFSTGEPSSADPKVIEFVGADGIVPRMDPDVPLVLVFSRPMDVASFGVKLGKKLVLPDPGNVELGWDDTRTIFIIERARPPRVRLSMIDLAGVIDDLGRYLRQPKPFVFWDGCPFPSGHPVLAHWPRGGASGMPTNTPLVILLRAKVDSYEVKIAPKPAHQSEWMHPSELVLVVYHSNLLSERDYTVDFAATDKHGNPLRPIRWAFKTGDALPETRSRVLGVSPVDHANNVPLDVRPLVVFTRRMITSRSDFRVAPSPLKVDWNIDPFARIALIRPTRSSVRSGQVNTWQILRARDLGKQDVITPKNPISWSFRIGSTPPIAPRVEQVQPSNNLLDVRIGQEIEITFSEPMERSSLDYEIEPEPDYSAAEWDPTGKTVTINHSDFRYQQSYTVRIKQARSQEGLPLSAGSLPVGWSFCTQPAPEEPMIRDVYPCHNDVHIPSDAPLLLLFNRAMKDIICRFGRVDGLPKTSELTEKKWSSDRTMVQIELDDPDPDAQYEVAIIWGIDMAGNKINLRRLTQIPNPWRFETVQQALAWRRSISGANLNVLVATALLAVSIAILTALGVDLRLRTESLVIGPWFVLSFILGLLVIPWILYHYRKSFSNSPSPESVITVQLIAIFAAGSAALRLWQGWLAVGAYTLTFAVLIIFLPLLLHRRRIFFSVSSGEEAILERHGEFGVIKGAAPHAWRVPLFERLRVIVPMHPLSVHFPSCRITNEYQEQVELALDVRYRVFASVSAFCHYLRKSDDQKDKFITSNELQAAWKDDLREVIELAVSDQLQKIRKSDIEKHRPDIERELMKILDLKAHRWGVELQDVKVAKIRDWNTET